MWKRTAISQHTWCDSSNFYKVVAQFSSHRPEKGNQVQQKYHDDEEILGSKPIVSPNSRQQTFPTLALNLTSEILCRRVVVADTCLVYCVLNKSVWLLKFCYGLLARPCSSPLVHCTVTVPTLQHYVYQIPIPNLAIFSTQRNWRLFDLLTRDVADFKWTSTTTFRNARSCVEQHEHCACIGLLLL